MTRNKGIKSKYGLAPHSTVVTNVGILRSVKGHEVTLQSVRRVLSEVPDAKYLIVGDGPRKAALADMVNKLGIKEHVIFTGFVENVSEIYSFSDVAVLSSWSEGLPQSLLQAMSAGVPVVATRVGGVPEVVVHEKTGMLIDAGDHEALAQSIIRVLSHDDFSAGLVKRARELVVKEHSTAVMIDRIEDLYKSLLTRKGIMSRDTASSSGLPSGKDR